jgi:hypothetical protein
MITKWLRCNNASGAICGREEDSLLRANHREFGIVKICIKCWSREQGKKNLLSLEGGSGCCR